MTDKLLACLRAADVVDTNDQPDARTIVGYLRYLEVEAERAGLIMTARLISAAAKAALEEPQEQEPAGVGHRTATGHEPADREDRRKARAAALAEVEAIRDSLRGVWDGDSTALVREFRER